jgi:hypothetical protein
MVQFVISSESIAPRRPNKAPDAPTDILFLMKREERTLPPNPERRYIAAILTENRKNLKFRQIKS